MTDEEIITIAHQNDDEFWDRHFGYSSFNIIDFAHALIAALAQPAEPVAWRGRCLDSKYWIIFQHYPVDAMNDPEREVQALFAAHPAQPVQPVLLLALAYVRWEAFGHCRTAGHDGPPPTANEVETALVAALAAIPPPQGDQS